MLSRPASRDPRSVYSKTLSLLNAFAFLKMALLPMAIITLFWKDQIGLSLTEILLLQAIFSVATMVMEFPSGYFSDRFGYRFALTIASVMGITGWTTYTLAGTFSGVLLAEIQLGISYAFISGADSALLFETLKLEGREEDYAFHDGRMTAWAQGGEAFGAIGAGFLYAWLPLLPFFLQIGIWVLALLLCRRMQEPPVQQALQQGPHLHQALAIARKAFADQPGLRYSILLAALLGLTSFYPVWLIQPHMQTLGVPLAWFGPIWAVANLMVSLGSIISHRLQFHLGARGLLVLSLLMFVIGYLGLGLTQVVWGFAFYYILTLMRGIIGPFLRLALQKQSTRGERASILSLKSLTFRLGFVLTGPLVGMLADNIGLHSTFLVMLLQGALIVPVMLAFYRYTQNIFR